MLTELEVRQAKPTPKVQRRFDGKGLYVEISPNGGKWWRLKYRVAGKERRLSLGVYPAVSVKLARQRCEEARALLDQGLDPSDQRKAEKAARRAARDNSFQAVAEAWYALRAKEWAVATASKVRSYLDGDLLPALGNRPIKEIRRRELVQLLAGIEERGAFNIAQKCREWIGGIFRYALVAEIIDVNPATDLHVVAAPGPSARHHPHIPVTELPALLEALDQYGGDPSTTCAIKLLLLTACRPGELRFAQWDEFDLSSATWAIPAERMKMRRPHVVPLPVQAVELIQAQFQLSGRRKLVFPNRDKPLLPISENTIGRALDRMGYKARQTAHGFRHLISTALNECGYNRDWVERQLSHGDRDQIRDVYNKAQYLDQRRQMMQEWADSLDASRRSAVVVGQFGRAA